MPFLAPFAALAGLAGTVASAALQSLIRAFLTEKRMRQWMIYGARALSKKYPESSWLSYVALDMEKDFETEFHEDI